ncbi:MAG: acetylglutamate kinase [Chitinispirillales bacterium]|jgi:acetylglutamate kinase|nr:acetylglutamate kinase [Chitinispirillales bacterium]
MSMATIKIGGSTIDTPGLLDEFAQGVKDLCGSYLPVIVHGGGKDIARQLDALNKEFTFVEGMRVTDEETVKVVQMVLSGDVNKRIVNELISKKVPAVGISGIDCGFIVVSKMLVNGQDIGFVGDIEQVNPNFVGFFLGGGYIPVISPVSRGVDGAVYNVNADLAASEIAISLDSEDLIFVSDVPGVKIGGEVRKIISISEIENLITAGDVTGGMIPKLRSAADAIGRGVKRVHICGWDGKDTLRNVLKGKSSGTVIQE